MAKESGDLKKPIQDIQTNLETKKSLKIEKVECQYCKTLKFSYELIENTFCSKRCFYLWNVVYRTEETFKKLIPLRYIKAKLSNFPKKITGKINLLNISNGVYIVNPTGFGKSWLASAILKHSIQSGWYVTEQGYDVKWISVSELLHNIKATFGRKNPDPRSNIIQSLFKVGLLVLDDMGAEQITDWSISTLYLILSKRYDELKPTIVTSNQTLEMIDDWEPRIASRLKSFLCIKPGDRDRRFD
jgi:DNA replication protein DnaC